MASSWFRISWVVLGLVALPSACGDDGGTDSTTNAMGSGTTDGGTTSPMASSSEGDTSNVMTGGMDSTGPGATSAPTTAAETETDGVTTGFETDGTACLGLGPRECQADDQCMPISGSPLVMSDGGVCIGPREFIECQPATGCGDAITYACETEGSMLYEFLDTCVPFGWVDCGPPPPIDIPPC